MTALIPSATVLGAKDAPALAEFYSKLLDWPIHYAEPDWVMLKPPGGGMGLSFQTESEHVPPRWPAGPGDQQMMMHLDIGTDDLPAAEQKAASLGATRAETQPQGDVTVFLDPAGHPFCLFLK